VAWSSPRNHIGVHPESLLFNRDPEQLAEDVIGLSEKYATLANEHVSICPALPCPALPCPEAHTWYCLAFVQRTYCSVQKMQVSCKATGSCSHHHGPFMSVMTTLCHVALWADKTGMLTSAVVMHKPFFQHGLHSLVQLVLHQFLLVSFSQTPFACCAETPEGPDQQAVLQSVSRAS